jgi:hypothetical protein
MAARIWGRLERRGRDDMRSFSKFLAVAVGLGCAASLAFATEQTILGKSFTVKQKPGDATSRKITGSGKEKGSPNTLVGDPTLAGSAGGAILQVFANGASPTAQTFVLPQGTGSTGKQFWSQSGTGFKYKDPKGDNVNPAVKSVSIKLSPSGSFSIKVKIAAKNGAVNVVPPNPGTTGCLALKLGQSAGAGDRYSVDFGVTSQIKNSADKLFKAKKPTVQAQCPTVTPTTTTSTSTSVTPTTTTSSSTGVVPTTTTSTTLYGSPSRAFLAASADLLD